MFYRMPLDTELLIMGSPVLVILIIGAVYGLFLPRRRAFISLVVSMVVISTAAAVISGIYFNNERLLHFTGFMVWTGSVAGIILGSAAFLGSTVWSKIGVQRIQQEFGQQRLRENIAVISLSVAVTTTLIAALMWQDHLPQDDFFLWLVSIGSVFLVVSAVLLTGYRWRYLGSTDNELAYGPSDWVWLISLPVAIIGGFTAFNSQGTILRLMEQPRYCSILDRFFSDCSLILNDYLAVLAFIGLTAVIAYWKHSDSDDRRQVNLVAGATLTLMILVILSVTLTTVESQPGVGDIESAVRTECLILGDQIHRQYCNGYVDNEENPTCDDVPMRRTVNHSVPIQDTECKWINRGDDVLEDLLEEAPQDADHEYVATVTVQDEEYDCIAEGHLHPSCPAR